MCHQCVWPSSFFRIFERETRLPASLTYTIALRRCWTKSHSNSFFFHILHHVGTPCAKNYSLSRAMKLGPWCWCLLYLVHIWGCFRTIHRRHIVSPSHLPDGTPSRTRTVDGARVPTCSRPARWLSQRNEGSRESHNSLVGNKSKIVKINNCKVFITTKVFLW